MRIGFSLPQVGNHAHNYSALPGYATTLEQAGAASLWVSDRILAPLHPTVNYPSTGDIPKAFNSVLDPLALIAAIGSVTTRAEIGTNVLIAPWYPPILLARMLTTLDVITNGRLIPGLGLGWSPEEYVAAGVPMNQRGRRLDETLDILDAYWTQNPVEYTGKYWTIPATHAELKPVRVPPVHLAAFTPNGIARTGQRAAGWMPATVAAPDFDATPLKHGLAAVRAEAEKAGRDPNTIGAVLRVNPRPDSTLDDILTTITRANTDAGIDHIYLDVNASATTDEALDLAQQVLNRLT